MEAAVIQHQLGFQEGLFIRNGVILRWPYQEQEPDQATYDTWKASYDAAQAAERYKKQREEDLKSMDAYELIRMIGEEMVGANTDFSTLMNRIIGDHPTP